MTRVRQCLIAIAIVATVACVHVRDASAQQPADDVRAISNIRDGLYRVQYGDEVTVFLVTSEGIVLVDPISPATAVWLRKEFETRFPDLRVRYVLFTSHQLHRASGGSMFDKTAETIGQERFPAERTEAAQRLGTKFLPLDSNHDGALQSSEFTSSAWAAFIRSQDFDGNGTVSARELYSTVPLVRRTFKRELTITLGGQTIDLRSTPVAQAEDMTVIVFPALRIAFAADVPVRAIPEQLGDIRVERLLMSLGTVEALPVDSILTARGETATVADVTAVREYMQDLDAGVRTAFADERTLSEVQDSLLLDKHSAMANFANARRGNIAETYARLRRSETTVIAAATFLTGPANVDFSSSGYTLEKNSWSGGILGVRFSVGRVGFGGQVQGNRPLTVHIPYAAGFGGTVIQTRDTVFAFPIAYQMRSSPDLERVSVSIEAGPSMVLTEWGETSLVFRSFRKEKFWELGWMAGASLRLQVSKRAAIVIPAHLMQGGSNLVGTRLLVGAGLSVGLTSGVR